MDSTDWLLLKNILLKINLQCFLSCSFQVGDCQDSTPHDEQCLWQDHTQFQCVEEVASSACPRTLRQCLRVVGLWMLVTFLVPPPFLCSWEPIRYGTALTRKQNLSRNSFFFSSLICNFGLHDLWAKNLFYNVCCNNLYLLLYTLSNMHTLLWSDRSDHWPEISNKGLSVTEDYHVRLDS